VNTTMSITPRLVSGTRDYLPEDMVPRQGMFDTIRRVFETFAFLPLDTPGLELDEVLTGGDPNFTKNIFSVGQRNSEKEDSMALRFDLTVPLARVIAQYGSRIEKPFKRYQTGKVWRGEKPQAGRFREFVQFDADIVGASSATADAEIVAIMYETMSALGFTNFLIKINNRKILNGLSEYAAFDSKKTAGVLRLIDKLDKVDFRTVSAEMKESLSLNDRQISAVKAFLDMRSSNSNETLMRVKSLMQNSPTAIAGVEELISIASSLKAMKIPEANWTIDLSIARGLGYYTGPVFETVLTDLPSIGSVFSGGRYDDLVERFGSDPIHATGASVGVDRLFAAMEKLELVKKTKTLAKVLVLNFDKNWELSAQSVASSLRRAGVSTELYLGKEPLLKGQLNYAVRQEFPFVVIIGSNEGEKRVAQVKDMNARTQKELPQDEVAEWIKSNIN